MDVLNTLLRAALAVIGTALGGLLIAHIRRVAALFRAIQQLSAQSRVQFDVTLHLVRAQRDHLRVSSRTATNGELQHADGELDAAERKLNEHAGRAAWGCE